MSTEALFQGKNYVNMDNNIASCRPWVICDKIIRMDFINIGISSFLGIQGDLLLDKQKDLEANFAVGAEDGAGKFYT